MIQDSACTWWFNKQISLIVLNHGSQTVVQETHLDVKQQLKKQDGYISEWLKQTIILAPNRNDLKSTLSLLLR